ncbi:TetR/AcrR family transcriptional regulator [Leucobacter albus]|uniref:TetR/AcrR family transcriptional regulator n=1 Tax=Leucobacter albus TaxID=272210 RepID=A0ABW3TQA3_9MICO
MTVQPANAADARAASALPEARRRDATENRERLLDAAQAAIAEQPNASLDSIAQAAGLTRRAVYGHFPDREALVLEVIAVGARRFAEIAASTVSADPRLALVHLATGLWRASVTVRASVNIATNEHYRAAAATAFAPLREKLAEVTRAGIESGALRADMTPEVLASLIEEAAKATLRDERITAGDSELTAIRVVLSIAGLSWVEQGELLAGLGE